MKKKVLTLLLAAVLVVGLFTGCGASSNSEAFDRIESKGEAPMEAPAAGEMGGNYGSSVTAPNTMQQKLIKRVNINAETEDLEALIPQIATRIGELGGYVESQELYNGGIHNSYRSRSLYMVARIPADRLAEFTSQVEGISNVVNYSETTDDVTLQYADTESRVKALEVEQERLLELLAKAENMTDLLEIEARLTDVRYELESYVSQLRVLDNKVSYATVNLSITQVTVYTEVAPQTVWQRIGSGFSRNLENIGEDLADFFVWITVYSPQLIFWGAVITLLVILRKRKGKKFSFIRIRRKKKEEPRDEG